jgi:hypothetical protein
MFTAARTVEYCTARNPLRLGIDSGVGGAFVQ